MTQLETIITELQNALNFTVTLRELYESTKFPKPSIRRILSNLTKTGTTERVSKGVYRFVRIFVKVLHTKRVIDTYTKHPQHRYDIDIESTSIGFVPSWVHVRRVEQVLNPKLITATIDQLGREGVFLSDDERLIKFSIMGTEFKDEKITKYQSRHDVTIDLINNSGVSYTFKTSFKVDEREW